MTMALLPSYDVAMTAELLPYGPPHGAHSGAMISLKMSPCHVLVYDPARGFPTPIHKEIP